MRAICLAGAVVLASTLQSPALAHDLGVRGILTASDGEPANDIPRPSGRLDWFWPPP